MMKQLFEHVKNQAPRLSVHTDIESATNHVNKSMQSASVTIKINFLGFFRVTTFLGLLAALEESCSRATS